VFRLELGDMDGIDFLRRGRSQKLAQGKPGLLLLPAASGDGGACCNARGNGMLTKGTWMNLSAISSISLSTIIAFNGRVLLVEDKDWICNAI